MRAILRPAEPQDCRTIWEWRNDSEARAASFSSDPIPYESHQRWYQAKLSDGNARLWMAEDPQGCPVAHVRLEIQGRESSISVHVDPARRGQGWGQAAIRQASGMTLLREPVTLIRAQIKRQNKASQAAFQKAGYQAAGESADGLEMTFPGPASAPPMRVLLRVAAGPTSGLGHLQRSLSLAFALVKLGAECRFLVDAAETEAIRRVEKAGLACEKSRSAGWDEADLRETAAVARDMGRTLVIVDSYAKGPRYVAGLEREGFFVASMEDQPPYATGSIALTGSSVVEGGAGHALLRPEFWPAPSRRREGKVRNVLLSSGGTDIRAFLPELVETLVRAPGDFTVTAVAGPFNAHRARLEAAVASSPRARLVSSPDEMLPLLLEADAAVSTAGQTLYELACVGCPTVALAVIANQQAQLEAFGRAGLTLPASGPAEAARLLLELVSDEPRRRALSKAGQAAVDGQGALRVARRVLEAAREASLT
jgi:spore coat polysaccharide biosynthesis predicted glycosyltransferase SpsG/RimJ/RimL family protein N-acetyltransferase